MAASTPQHPPPIRTIRVETTSSDSPSDGSSTLTPGLSTARPTTTPFSPFPPTPDYEDDVHSPSLTSGNALARFEFEKLDAKDGRDVGTKVLMVEWVDDESTKNIKGSWTISWEGRSVAAVVDTQAQSHARSGKKADDKEVHRLYFLLPHWTRVPGTVVLTLNATSTDQKPTIWRTHPLPAIYPSSLGNTVRASGKRGVLHTVWAKKRLQSLADEIEKEENENPEGVSLDLAIQEREWIEANFGVKTKPRKVDLSSLGGSSELQSGGGSPGGNTAAAGELHSPTSPKSPGRGPLFEKLKGLRLATTSVDLQTKQAEEAAKENNPLSPETADVAVSWTSFASLNGLGGNGGRDALAAKPAQVPQQQQQGMRTIAPPESVREQQRGLGAMGSLNAFTAPAASSSEVQFRVGELGSQQPVAATGSSMAETNEEEDLFALPLSPRSPDRGSKKFTFGAEDTARYTPVSSQ